MGPWADGPCHGAKNTIQKYLSICQFRYEPERSGIKGVNQAADLDRRLNKLNSLSRAKFMALAACKSL